MELLRRLWGLLLTGFIIIVLITVLSAPGMIHTLWADFFGAGHHVGHQIVRSIHSGTNGGGG